jgi:hypothetical protein
MGGLGGSSKGPKGYGGWSSSSSTKNWALSSRLGSMNDSKDAALTSSIGFGSRQDSLSVFREGEMDIGRERFFLRKMFNFPVCPS